MSLRECHRECIENINGTVVVRANIAGAKQSFTVKANGPDRVFVAYDLPPGPLDKGQAKSISYVRCLNPEYGFVLSAVEGNGWVLQSLMTGEVDENRKNIQLDDVSLYSGQLSPLNVVPGIKFHDFLSKDEYDVFEVSICQDKKVEFSFSRKSNVVDDNVADQFGILPVRGKVKLDPENNWMPVECSMVNRFRQGIEVESKRSYVYPDKGSSTSFCLPREMTITSGKERTVANFTWALDGSSLTNQEFQLAHFGIKEPMGLGGRSPSRIYVVVGVAVLIVVLGTVLRTRKS